MNELVVFTGPTLSATAASAILSATILPPVSQGDVYRVSRRDVRAIAIIDGYFDRVPAVWHKEILWAMARGIHVFGSSSMGALRAAELAPFGMRGIGRIFRAFQSGEVDDDEEVVVAHGDADTGYRATSEAMFNVRATCQHAVEGGVISAPTRQVVERVAKGIFYPGRTYAAILAGARRELLDAVELDALEEFLPSGRVDQKRADAIEMLTTLRDAREELARPRPPVFAFEHTDSWDQAMATAGEEGDVVPDRDSSTERLGEELRLRCQFESVRRGAMLRAIAAEETRRQGLTIDVQLRDATQESFRRERDLLEDGSIRRWLSENRLSETDFGRFLEDEARLRWLEAMHAQDALHHQHAELLATGMLASVQARAEHKEAILSRAGLSEPESTDCPLTPEALLKWYFEDRLRRPPPTDVASHLAMQGLSDEPALRREARREFLYLRLTANGASFT